MSDDRGSLDRIGGAPAPARYTPIRVGGRAIVFLIAAGVLYALLFSINKIAMTNGVPTLGYVFWHTLGAGFLQLIGCAALGDLPGLSLRHLRIYLVGGATGIVIPVSLLAYVAPNLPASIVVMVIVLSPMLTYLMALSLKMERFQILSVLGILIGLGGVLMLVVPGVSLPNFEMVSWLLLAILAPVCFAAFNILAAVWAPPQGGSLPFACGVQLGATVILVPIMLGTGQTYLFPGPLLAGDLAILWATLVTAVVWYLVLEIIRLAGPVFLSQFGYIVVLTGFGWGALIFGERLSALLWVAAALLLGGLALLTLGKRRQQRLATANGVN